MLKEAIDMLGAGKDIRDVDCYSVSNSTISDPFGMGSVRNSPKRNSNESFFEPDFLQKNPFASNSTLNLMRNTSLEFALSPLIGSDLTLRSRSRSRDQNDTLFDADEDLNLSDLKCNDLNSVQQEAESCTGKFSPVQDNQILQFDLKQQKIERKRIQKAPKQPKRKSQKLSAKTLKTRNYKKDSKKDSKKNPVNNFKRESKNVVKNYGKAMAAFSLNDIAIPYLEVLVADNEVSIEDFRNFMINRKETIDSIGSLRDLFCPDFKIDTPQELRFKAVFRAISKVFVRDFAINWIFTSKSQYKSALINYRYKILRRVVDPASFTYLKSQ